MTWSSSNVSVATVNNISGLITSIIPGSATITATTVDSSALSSILDLIVSLGPPVLATKVNISPDSPPILNMISPTLQFTAIVLPSSTTKKTVTWISSNTSVATINSSTGLATRVGYGSTIIRAITTDGSNKVTAISLRVR